MRRFAQVLEGVRALKREDPHGDGDTVDRVTDDLPASYATAGTLGLMATAPRHLNDEEAHRESGRLLSVLEKVGLRDGDVTRWWNDLSHTELSGRTASQAWQAGDYFAVSNLVEKFASQQLADAISDNPQVARRLLEQSTDF
jgi:hypothetical protein